MCKKYGKTLTAGFYFPCSVAEEASLHECHNSAKIFSLVYFPSQQSPVVITDTAGTPTEETHETSHI